MKIKYRRALIDVGDIVKSDRCEGCRKKAKKLDFHHWIYAHTTKEVRKNHSLALKNTSVLCFRCHMVGDALRKVLEDENLSNRLLELMDKVIK